MILFSPSLWLGFVSDDLMHRLYLLDELSLQDVIDDGLLCSFTEMYDFTKNDSDFVSAAKDIGQIPWWTSDNWNMSFFRPLTEATHRLDYWLWPDTPLLMHLHSLLWAAGILFLVSNLYRKNLNKPWIAGLATLLFAITHTHAIPVSWLANRNALIAVFFGVLSLLAHDRWRKDGWKAGAVLGPFCLTLSLLAAEFALATCAYLLSYALFLDNGRARARVVSLSPYGPIVAAWAVVYRALGFGTTGSGMYTTPFNDPAGFAAKVLERLPILLGGQWGILIEDYYSILEKPAFLHVISAVLILAVVAVVFPLLRRDRVARFWGFASLLSLVPVCATFTSGRLLMFSNIGAMGLMAQAIGAWYEQDDRLPARVLWRGAARVLVFLLISLHLIVSPLFVPLAIGNFKAIFEYFAVSPGKSLPVTPRVAAQDLVLVNPPSTFYALYLWRYREFEKMPNPSNLRVFASGANAPMEIKRLDEQTLKIKIDKGFHRSFLADLFYDFRVPMKVGQRVEVKGPSARIVSLSTDSYPKRVEYLFGHRVTKNLLNVWKRQLFLRGVDPDKVRKAGEQTIEAEFEGENMRRAYEVCRQLGIPMRVGELAEFPSMTAEILSLTEDSYPMEVSFRFSVPLESKLLKFLRWESDRFVPFELPRIGETVHLEASSLFERR